MYIVQCTLYMCTMYNMNRPISLDNQLLIKQHQHWNLAKRMTYEKKKVNKIHFKAVWHKTRKLNTNSNTKTKHPTTLFIHIRIWMVKNELKNKYIDIDIIDWLCTNALLTYLYGVVYVYMEKWEQYVYCTYIGVYRDNLYSAYIYLL